jgi:hypothetical protein
MTSQSESPIPPTLGARWWVYGTTMLSVLCMVIWGIDLLVRGRAPLLYDLTPRGQVGCFGTVTVFYAAIMVIRLRIVRVPAAANPEDWRIAIGMFYWIVTIPCVVGVGLLVVFWNGLPGV